MLHVFIDDNFEIQEVQITISNPPEVMQHFSHGLVYSVSHSHSIMQV